MNKPELSIAIAYYNDGIPDIMEAIDSIKSTIDIDNYEIIVCDDHSTVPLVLHEEKVRVVRQKEHMGVGMGLTLGVESALSDNVFIQGNDIRYTDNGWASKMIEAIDENPKSVICTLCVGMNRETPDGMNFAIRQKRAPRRNGSTVLMYHDSKVEKQKPDHFRNIVECKWLKPVWSKGLEEIPCVLGAAYIVKKDFFLYVDPWRWHRSWGTLEPLIGVLYWLMGGSNLCHHGVETGHIFNRSRPRNFQHLQYNKFVAAHLLFPDDLTDKLISFMANDSQVASGREMFNKEKSSIFVTRDLIREKATMNIRDYCKLHNIDLRE